jgi:site-specific DNA-adenine methylase
MIHTDVFEYGDNEITRKAAIRLFELFIEAEEERIKKTENGNHSDFSFRSEYFQQVKNHLL